MPAIRPDDRKSEKPKTVQSDWEKVQLKKDDPVFKGIVERGPKVEEPLPDLKQLAEFRAYIEVLRHAYKFPMEMLEERSARNVPYDSLQDDKLRGNYLRSLLRVRGKQVRVYEKKVPRDLQDAGVEKLYEAWIEVDNSPDKLVCFLFTDLPKELRAGSLVAHLVDVDGYYVKLMAYPVPNGNGGFDTNFAPLLMGRTMQVLEEEPVTPAEGSEADRIQLDKSLPLWREVKDEKPLVSRYENNDEYTAYDNVILKTREFSPEAFAKHSRKDWIFADMLNDRRDDYLRDLLHVEGTLVRLRKVGATERLKATSAIKDLYEGWIVHVSNPEHLIEVVLTELPPGLEPAERMSVKVSLDGYYFKVIRYETNGNAQTKSESRKAPLLIGRTIEVHEPEPSVWSMANPLIPALMVVLGMIGVGSIGLMIWFRRGDRIVHQKTQESLTRINPFNEQNRESPPPVEPGNDWNRLEDR